MVDEAHATGVLGPEGRGAWRRPASRARSTSWSARSARRSAPTAHTSAATPTWRVPREHRAHADLLDRAGATVVAAALAALELVREQPRRIERVRRNAQTLREALGEQGFDGPPGETAIVPLVVGDAARAMAVCERALQRGVFAQAIRPPTVPEGSSRLRLAAMATHNAAELEWAAAQLGAAAREAGATRRAASQRSATVFDHARAA